MLCRAPAGGPSGGAPPAEASELAKADLAWEEDAAMADSFVRDLMRGQLQSSVVCSKCSTRSTHVRAPRTCRVTSPRSSRARAASHGVS